LVVPRGCARFQINIRSPKARIRAWAAAWADIKRSPNCHRRRGRAATVFTHSWYSASIHRRQHRLRYRDKYLPPPVYTMLRRQRSFHIIHLRSTRVSSHSRIVTDPLEQSRMHVRAACSFTGLALRRVWTVRGIIHSRCPSLHSLPPFRARIPCS
jgi:hypothetical protein